MAIPCSLLALVALQLVALELGRRMARYREAMGVEYGQGRRSAQGRVCAEA